MKPNKEQQFWHFVTVIGAGLSFYLVFNGIPTGLILGYICVWHIGIYSNQHYSDRRPEEKPNSWEKVWRMRFIDLKGWDNMTDGERRVFTKGVSSHSSGMQASAMKKELAELEKKYPWPAGIVLID